MPIKKIMFRNCALFTNCISKVNNTQVDNAHDIDVVMPMYNLIEYSDTFWKTSECLYQYYRDKPTLNNNSNIIDFPNDNNSSILFQFKQQITGQTEKNGTKIVEIVFPLKYLRNFWRTLEMPLIN